MKLLSAARLRLGVMIMILGAATIGSATGRVLQTEKPAFKVDDLSWMSGDWETAPGRVQIEEHWTKPSGGALLGVGRTIAGGKMVFFEYLRIETRGTEIFYVAQPKGGTPGTDFKLVKSADGEAVFENLQHDFPKRIIYRKQADGGLTARIEGDGTEKEKPQEFKYRKAGS